ncbi:MAG: DUF721 domain-containing protein [Desulfobulbaceae bacterium]|nr:DUF721 domain-containing protein [Desulfobulbaceae bacterium]
MEKSGTPEKIGSLLTSLFGERNWQRRLGLHALFSFWDEVVEEAIGRRAQPDLIRDTVLWVRVSDSVWMQHLHLMKNVLLDKLNQRLGEVKLTDIRFRIDSTLGRVKPPQPPPKPAPPVDQARLQQAEAMFASLADEELRKTLRRLWLKTESRRRSP